MPYADVSISRKNGLVKSGCRSTGMSVMALRSISNAVCLSVCQDQGVKLPRGLSVRLECFQVMAIVWERRKMLPAELR
jgi:hypothetical protein